jgi:peptidoglycan/xylan/chitin deacetylase (PgdA/CDA1 family)
MSLSTFARRSVKAAALPLGVAGMRRPRDIIILLYHRVGVGDREIDLHVRDFDRQVEFLAAHEPVKRLTDAVRGDGTGGVVVTVDDGYRDFHEHVLPILDRYQVPALLYLATGLVANGAGPVDPDALTWTQLAEAVSTGLVDVGAHTHGHVDLSRAPERVANEEMRRSKELVEDTLGIPCTHFAYPWAVGSVAADGVARRLFDTAALGAWQTNRSGRTDLHRLGRVPVLRSDGATFFRAKVKGLLNGEAVAYRLARRGPWGRS